MKSDAIIGAVEGVTKKWAKQRKREEREASARLNRRTVMGRRHHVTIAEAAWQVMETAYLKASANGRLPAHARQIMYAARPEIQRLADRPLGKRFDQYFSQQLLPDYINEHGVSWNVVFDARGHFHEPHTEKEVALGTLQVRKYLSDVAGQSVSPLDFDIWENRHPTVGPRHRYGAILFIEKEGFMPLFEEVKLAERYDLAIMSTKGMSVTAARSLVDSLCAEHNIPLLVLHDFDKAGFSIVGTLHRDTRRYSFANRINVIDLGIRIADIDGLETEDVHHSDSEWKVRANLRKNGATDDEIEFLLNQRVELNAFASDELIEWIEGKLDERGIKKVVPDGDDLADAYQRMQQQSVVQRRIDALLADMQHDDADAPEDLTDQVADLLEEEPELSWDTALKRIVAEAIEDDEGAET